MADAGDRVMQPHEERVVAEKNELIDRLIKLDAFLDGEVCGKLHDIDKGLLIEQREYMANYLEILFLRIERFGT